MSHQPRQSRPQQHLGAFGRLPSNVRERIYELSLAPSRPGALFIRADRPPTWFSSGGRIGPLDLLGSKSYMMIEGKHLLEVSRTIHAEATPFLYGSNHLSIATEYLEAFIDAIGPSVAHLRHVTIRDAGHEEAHIKFFSKILAPAVGLQNLTLSCRPFNRRPRPCPNKMALLLKSWMLDLMDAYPLSTDDEPYTNDHFASIVRLSELEPSFSAYYFPELPKPPVELLDRYNNSKTYLLNRLLDRARPARQGKISGVAQGVKGGVASTAKALAQANARCPLC